MASREVTQFIERVRTAPQGACGTLIDTRSIYLELGRHMDFPLCTTSAPTRAQLAACTSMADWDAVYPQKERHMQATIRDIKLAKRLQKKGLFTALVKFLLERDGAVHLEAVQPKWLKRRLAASPLWIRQSVAETDDPGDEFNPCYARFVTNTPFSLF